VTWEQATGRRKCGACGEEIPVGAPVLLVTEHRLARCAACAARSFGETVPDEFATPAAQAGRLVFPASWQKWLAPGVVDSRMRRAEGREP
jgi:hypothetical protein